MSEELKNSGIYWLGFIPKSWTLGHVKNFYTLQTGFTPDTKNDSYYDDINGKLWVNISDMGNSHYINETKKKISDKYIDKFDPIIVPKGSLLYSFKLSVGTVAFAGCDLYTNEAIASFLTDDRVNLNYLYYSSQICIVHNANENIYGAKLLNQDLIKNALIVFPPLPIQQKIADYLDKVCGEIDDMIALQEKMIEELKAYKQSVITEAVTKGLNPNVPMRDSGIDWIKQIPSHWTIITPKALFSMRKDKAINGERQLTASQQYGIVYQDEYMKFTGSKVVTVLKDFDILKHVEKGDFVISMRSFQGGLEYSLYTGSISSAYVMLIPNPKYVYPRFYRWLFKSECYINALQSTSNMVRDGQAMRYSNFVQIPLYSIPIDEQQSIADFLDTKCSEINSLIAIKQEKIEELKDYKKSVIYEYVTGKKQVN